MGIKIGFFDDTDYGATEINNIIKNLASAGVINESDTSCKVIADTANTVRISPGNAIMHDGSFIEINDEPETVILESAVLKNYVYFKKEGALNTIQIKATTAVPTGDYVLLAEVIGSTVVDARQYSSFKITRGLGNGYFVKKNLTISGTVTKAYEWAKAHEEDVGSPLFTHATINDSSYNASSGGWFGYFDFVNEKLFGYVRHFSDSRLFSENFGNGLYMQTGSPYGKIKLVYNGTKLEFWVTCDTKNRVVTATIDLLMG